MNDSLRPTTPGTWRESDGGKVPFSDALAAWKTAARDELIGVAHEYHAYITYSQLANQVQERTGIRTRMQMRNWIGKVLGAVADDCHARAEPPLSALCVHQDETVGDGYVYVLKIAGEDVPEDLDEHAAIARLDCYKHFGATLPADGGAPALTKKVAARKKAALKVEAPPKVCSTCFTQLPATGQCDNCQ